MLRTIIIRIVKATDKATLSVLKLVKVNVKLHVAAFYCDVSFHEYPKMLPG